MKRKLVLVFILSELSLNLPALLNGYYRGLHFALWLGLNVILLSVFIYKYLEMKNKEGSFDEGQKEHK